MITSDPRREPGGSCVSEPVATRREVGQLRADINRIDDHGTRGVGALQAQMTGFAADLAELKAGVAAQLSAHQRVHDQDHLDRVSGRRWFVGTGFTALLVMATVIGLLIDIARHTHS